MPKNSSDLLAGLIPTKGRRRKLSLSTKSKSSDPSASFQLQEYQMGGGRFSDVFQYRAFPCTLQGLSGRPDTHLHTSISSR